MTYIDGTKNTLSNVDTSRWLEPVIHYWVLLLLKKHS